MPYTSKRKNLPVNFPVASSSTQNPILLSDLSYAVAQSSQALANQTSEQQKKKEKR